MAYVSLFEAVCVIMRKLGDGEEDAVDRLERAIQSGGVDVVVAPGDRPLSKVERSYRVDPREERLVPPIGFGDRPALTGVLVDGDAVKDLAWRAWSAGHDDYSLVAEPEATGEPPPKRSKGGRPPKIDWPAIEEHIKARVDERGHPFDVDQMDGWRTIADVIEDARAARMAGAEDLSKSWAYEKVGEILQRIKADSGN
jgi:hypothetical protein